MKRYKKPYKAYEMQTDMKPDKRMKHEIEATERHRAKEDIRQELEEMAKDKCKRDEDGED